MLLNVPSPVAASWNYTPLALFTILCGLLAVLYLLPNKRAQSISRFYRFVPAILYWCIRHIAGIYVVGDRS